MKKLFQKNKLLLIIFCILLPIFLILFSYKIVLFNANLTSDQQNAINFLNDKEKLALNYTANEVSHLEDVKKVMNFFEIVFYFSLLILTLIITYFRRNKQQLRKLFYYGGIVTVAVVLIKLIVVLLSFNFAFTIFHNILFPQGNWMFPMGSVLIQTFPLQFFINMSVWIFGATLLLGIFFILLAHYLKDDYHSKRY